VPPLSSVRYAFYENVFVMPPDKILKIKTSKVDTVFGLCVCVILILIAYIGGVASSLSLVLGKYLMTVFVLIAVFFLVVLGGSSTEFTSTGLRIRRLNKQWSYSWKEVSAWGVEHFPNGELTGIWIETGDPRKKTYIQPIPNEIEAKKVKLLLNEKIGPNT